MVSVWVGAAVAVTCARLLHPIRAGQDISWQILAAQNLLDGNGLSIFQHTSATLNDPPVSVPLTHFPAGYSLAIAALLALGLNEAFAMKALGAAATLLGWWGWGRLAHVYQADGMLTDRWTTAAALAIAALTPLLFTLPWPATDILLWAIVPWAVHAVVAGDRKPAGWPDYLAGVLIGTAVFMRYAGVFLVLFCAGMMILQKRNRPTLLIRRLAVLAVGAAPFLGVQVWINSLAAVAAPGGVSVERTAAEPLERLFAALSLTPVANFMWTFWLPGKVLAVVLDTMTPWRWTLGLLAIVFISLSIVFWKHGSAAFKDRRTVALGLFVIVPAVLVGAMLFSPYGYVADRRYYSPVVPLVVLVAWWVVFSGRRDASSALPVLLRAPAGAYVAAYVLAVIGYTVLMVTPTAVGATQRMKLLGDQPLLWPSFAEGHSLSASRRLVVRMLNERPDALLFTSRPMVFLWDRNVDRAKLYELTCAWASKRIRGPADILLVTFDRGNSTDLWSYWGAESFGETEAADCFEGLADLEMVQRFPDEGLKVLRARVAAGDEYIIRP